MGRNEGRERNFMGSKGVARDDVVSCSSVNTHFEGWKTETFSPPFGQERMFHRMRLR